MKAKELILETNMKINDIAKEVAIQIQVIFIVSLKSSCVSPSTLREMKNY